MKKYFGYLISIITLLPVVYAGSKDKVYVRFLSLPLLEEENEKSQSVISNPIEDPTFNLETNTKPLERKIYAKEKTSDVNYKEQYELKDSIGVNLDKKEKQVDSEPEDDTWVKVEQKDGTDTYFEKTHGELNYINDITEGYENTGTNEGNNSNAIIEREIPKDEKTSEIEKENKIETDGSNDESEQELEADNEDFVQLDLEALYNPFTFLFRLFSSVRNNCIIL